ncbi:FHA domain-containing protein [Mycolicibacterium sp.]|uniref:FHA domain-containing protein n=1 Tax=Mycolicibacterium sp. TaxID=2320850 RepID=UPI0037CC3237
MENARRDEGALVTSANQPLLTIVAGGEAYTIGEDAGPITIGRELPAQVRVPDPRISSTHLRVQFHNGIWTATDRSSNGVFLDGHRKSVITLADGMTVLLGHPVEGIPIQFRIADGHEANAEDDDIGADSEGLRRAGAAVAARREELRISQRTLAREKVMNAGALIAFEKGRSWPRAETREKLEKVLQWPPGTIESIKESEDGTDDVTELIGAGTTTIEARFMGEAIEVALDAIRGSIDALPEVSHKDFNYRAATVLADLRRLETVAVNAARNAKGAPGVVAILGRVRNTYRDLMLRAADSSHATVGQRLFAARYFADINVDEAAMAAGLTPEVIVAAESDTTLTDRQRSAVERLIAALQSGRQRR